MKTLVQKYSSIVVLLCLTTGCDSDISGSFGEDPDPGSADFSTFVAVGDSLTAGYADNALYRHGQQNSFPAIMAQQFTTVGGGVFNQPLMLDGRTGSLTLTMLPLPVGDRLVLVPTGNPDRPASPADISPTISSEISDPLETEGIPPYNNMGVPGAKSYHLSEMGYGNPLGVGVGSANPYFVRFADDQINSSVIGDAVAQVPSFFVLWIGYGDVLGYATGGGVDNQGVGAPPYPNDDDITDPAEFNAIYNDLVASLNTPGNKGVLINIPDVTTMPYFTTVPYDAIPMDADTAVDSNSLPQIVDHNAEIAASALSPADKAERTITFVVGDNAVVIDDDELPTEAGISRKWRQATAADYVVLPTLPKIGTEAIPGNPTTVWGVGTPLADADVLSTDEVDRVESVRTDPDPMLGYNATIKAAADDDPDLLLFDADAFFTELSTTGILYGSGGISSTFGLGGGISLDGIHPTARGYAVIANEMFKLINAGFGGYIPPVDPSDYTTVFYQ
jgi:lysophospholipase L1-like esterase